MTASTCERPLGPLDDPPLDSWEDSGDHLHPNTDTAKPKWEMWPTNSFVERTRFLLLSGPGGEQSPYPGFKSGARRAHIHYADVQYRLPRGRGKMALDQVPSQESLSTSSWDPGEQVPYTGTYVSVVDGCITGIVKLRGGTQFPEPSSGNPKYFRLANPVTGWPRALRNLVGWINFVAILLALYLVVAIWTGALVDHKEDSVSLAADGTTTTTTQAADGTTTTTTQAADGTTTTTSVANTSNTTIPVPELDANGIETRRVSFFWDKVWDTNKESALMVEMALIGALGAGLFGIRSFARHIGMRRYEGSWTWWYVVRLPVGAILALLIFFLIRGGILNPSIEEENINPYGMAGIAGLAGMFSRQVVNKLEELTEVAFAIKTTSPKWKRTPDARPASGQLPLKEQGPEVSGRPKVKSEDEEE